MTHIEQSITIPAQLEDVFAFASDYSKWADWFSGVSDFRPITPVTKGNGARYAYKARLMGLSVSVETEIHDYLPNQGWRGISTKGIDAQTIWTFQSSGNDTRFSYALEYSLPIPWLSKHFDALFMRPQWNRIIITSLENLRRHFVATT